MTGQAKANAADVKKFKQSVSAARDYSSDMNKGNQCLNELFILLQKTGNTVEEKIDKMKQAENSLSEKIDKIQSDITRLTARLESLNDKLDRLEEKLSHTEEHGDGPGYAAVSAKIAMVNAEILSVSAQLSKLEKRLDNAIRIQDRMESHTDALESVYYSLSEKTSLCRQLIDELGSIQNNNQSRGSLAADSLKRIEEIIAEYLHIKMKYEDTSRINMSPAGRMNNYQTNVHINIQINKTEKKEENVPEELVTEESDAEDTVVDLTAEKIEGLTAKALIEDKPRVIIFDDKVFGGRYVSYTKRMDQTPVDDNPMIGWYEGTRGESKFIPSNRTAEGIQIKEILAQYGIDGIIYRNAEPDFEQCAEAVVKITGMTENRDNYRGKDGDMQLGNFAQADIELAERWKKEKRDGRTNWEPREVLDYRKANRLTWHEKCDTETMVLVRFEINFYFKHSGGCAECRERDSGESEGVFDE